MFKISSISFILMSFFCSAQSAKPKIFEIKEAIKESIDLRSNYSGTWTSRNTNNTYHNKDTIQLYEHTEKLKWCDYVDWKFKKTNKMRHWETVNDNCNPYIETTYSRQAKYYKLSFSEVNEKTYIRRFLRRKLIDTFEVISVTVSEIIDNQELKKMTLVRIKSNP